MLVGNIPDPDTKEARYHDGKQETEYPGEVLCDRRGKETDGTEDDPAPDEADRCLPAEDGNRRIHHPGGHHRHQEMNKLLSAIGRNINQIAKRVNAGRPSLPPAEAAHRQAQPAHRHSEQHQGPQSAGYKPSATIENLKRAAETLNFLTSMVLAAWRTCPSGATGRRPPPPG